MKVVFDKTLRNMFKPLIMSIYISLTIIITILIVLANIKDNSLLVTIPSQIESLKVVFTSLVFFYIGGIGLILLIMIFGLDIFATEEYEGTMKILVAKPVSRSSIIIGKILGLVLGTFIYFISTLLISLALFSIFTRIDRDVFIGLIKIVPSFILYGIFVIILFSSLSALLSSLFRKKVPSIILFVLLVLGTFGIMPILRSISIQRNVYYESKLYILDLNSHLGNLFMEFVEQGKEENEIYSTSLNMFTGRYISSLYDPDIDQTNYSLMKKNDVISANIILLVYLSISILFFLLTYRKMIKKDIT